MSRPYTILQILPKLHQTGGVERGTVEIASAIVNAGDKALVASTAGEMCTRLAQVGGTHIPLPLDTKNPLKIWLNAARLEKVIRKHKVDLVHARSRAPAWSAYLACKRTNTPFITTFHGQYTIQNEWKKKYNSIMLRGRLTIAVSHFIKQHILDNYPAKANKIHVIHRGVDLKAFSPDRVGKQRIIDLLRQWNVPEHLPIILFPGRVTRWKGQDVFVKALAQLGHKDFFAVLLGDDTQHPKYRAEVEQLISTSGLEGHVRMVGSTANMTEAYQLAKFVVATSVEPEAFGRVVLEAQAMGKPVIATRHGGACETVIEQETGLLVPPGDVQELTNAISNTLAMSEEDIAAVGKAGMEQAKQFSTHMMCEKTLAIYHKLLNSKEMSW